MKNTRKGDTILQDGIEVDSGEIIDAVNEKCIHKLSLALIQCHRNLLIEIVTRAGSKGFVSEEDQLEAQQHIDLVLILKNMSLKRLTNAEMPFTLKELDEDLGKTHDYHLRKMGVDTSNKPLDKRWMQ